MLPKARLLRWVRIRRIRKSGKASVVFILSSLPMWRTRRVYETLAADSRFNVSVVLYPFSAFGPEQGKEAIVALRNFCSTSSIPFLDLSGYPSPGKAMKEQFDPDIIFYPQPYNRLFYNDLDSTFFSGRLLCYVPYYIHTFRDAWVYKSYLYNTAWRIFLMLDDHKEDAKEVLYNHASNVRIVGDPQADFFQDPVSSDPWKLQETPKKRIIWAPHFSIAADAWLHRDSFTRMHLFMLELADRYRDQIQIAFKPHPKLLSALQENPDWGLERAENYYRKWESGSNTQLELGPYIDLFKSSDALIHDCGSFSVEYHFTGKPVLFCTQDIEKSYSNLNELGRQAVSAHYKGSSEADVEAFIKNTVLEGEDPMKPIRMAFRERYLTPKGEGSVAKNICNELNKSLWG